MKAGSKLIIPISPGHHDAQAVAYSHQASHYKVRKGDTVESVADDFEVPVEKLRKWNHLEGAALTPGRTLIIYKPSSSESAEAESSDGSSTPAKAKASSQSQKAQSAEAAKYHKVKKGETLSSIAESNHTSVAALKRDNPRLTANVRAGEVLLIRK